MISFYQNIKGEKEIFFPNDLANIYDYYEDKQNFQFNK